MSVRWVTLYEGVPPESLFGSTGGLGTPIVVDTLTQTPYIYIPGVGVTALAGGGGGGHTIADEGVALANRAVLDFAGAGVAVTDTGVKTLVTIPGGGSGGGNLDEVIALQALL